MRFDCPACHCELEAEPQAAGVATQCPVCRQKIVPPVAPVRRHRPRPVPMVAHLSRMVPLAASGCAALGTAVLWGSAARFSAPPLGGMTLATLSLTAYITARAVDRMTGR